MSTLFKDLFSESFYLSLAQVMKELDPGFDDQRFIALIYTSDFSDLEMKQRIRHTSRILHQFLPDSFAQAADTIVRLTRSLEASGVKADSLENLFLADYIECYGQDDVRTSMAAIEVITPFITCEFAVRPFIIRYPEQMWPQMMLWARHSNRRVRRLASEGYRPRLPWGIALPALKQDPTPLEPILLSLMRDECELVRRSVANNLNDIAKDNPEFVIRFSRQHYGMEPELDKVIKHGCRSLLKQAEPQTLALFGYHSQGIHISAFRISCTVVQVGAELEFSFKVHHQHASARKIRLEYGIYYRKKSGFLAKKVFKISEREINGESVYPMIRKHSFAPTTIRKLYPGPHQVTIIINGLEFEKLEFELKN